MHRIVGALSATHRGGIYAGLERFAEGKPENYGMDVSRASFLERLAHCRLVFLGEVHSVPQITSMQLSVLDNMARSSSKVNVVLEHFSFEMQDMLDDYKRGAIDFNELTERYKEIGTEGHELKPYRGIMEHARKSDNIALHAGFLSRNFARMLMSTKDEAKTLKAATQWIDPASSKLEGGSFHYNLFESMLSGRSVHDEALPEDRFKGIFKAQLLKDTAMAQKIATLIEDAENDDEKFLIIAGNGHVANYQGVPQRVLKAHPGLIDRCCVITSHEWEGADLIDTVSAGSILQALDAGPPGANPADFLFVYQSADQPELVKAEVQEAYDKVGSTATVVGNADRAAAIMTYLGYNKDQIDLVESDVFNYQGVGNPFRNADIQEGDTVLDVGSRLGIDSFIAASMVGEKGSVVGIDLSRKEVEHAKTRAEARGANVNFQVADMERMPFADNMFDKIISNGAFCLAPNRAKAFAELFRVLKPGGKISVYTTAIQADSLDQEIEWPLCMRMFVSRSALVPMIESLGYENIVIDDSDSKMTFHLPEELMALNPERCSVHVGDSRFEHLDQLDMDKLCERVCIVARKPMDRTEQPVL